MAMEPDEIRRIAELARLELADGELERTARELSSILDFAATLRGLDLERCEPSAFAPTESPLREDACDDRRLSPEQATAAAPETEDGFFIVPPVVENLQP